MHDAIIKNDTKIVLSTLFDRLYVLGNQLVYGGSTLRQIADDLGIDMSTLNKWITAHCDTDVVSAGDRALARENEQLRREIRILKEERDILKKPPSFLPAK